jgi:hypothetical protein
LERFSCEIEYQDESWTMFKFANTSLAIVLPKRRPYHFAIVTDGLSPYGDAIPYRDCTASVYIQDSEEKNIEMLRLPNEGDAS